MLFNSFTLTCFNSAFQVLNKKIVMLWRFNSWPPGMINSEDLIYILSQTLSCIPFRFLNFHLSFLEHYSTVTIELTQKDDRTELKFLQTGIPSSDFERTKNGWNQYYWSSIKQTFGIGMKYF